MNSTWKSAFAGDTGKILKTAGYYLAFVGLGLTSASLGPTLPGLAEHTQSRLGEISFLFTARSLGYLLGSLRGGRWYDHISGHRIMFMVLFLMAAMLALVPVIPWLWLLAAALMVLGFGEGTLDVGGNILLVWVHRDRVAPFMNGLHFFFGIGAFLSPVIIAQAVLMSGDITWAYWALALLMLPVIAFLARLPSPAIQAGPRDGQAGVVNVGLVVLLAVFFFLNVGAEASFGGWIFTYATAQSLGTEVTAAYLTSAFWGALTVGRLLAIPISTRVRPRWILLGDILGCLASLSLILFWQASYVAVWLGALGMGLFMASVFPTTITFAERHLPINGRITGWFFVGSSAGGMFFPWLIGQLFEPLGPPTAIRVILSAMILALVNFVVLVLYLARGTAESQKKAEIV